MRTAVALGSNIGDRLENLRAARNSILRLPNLKPPILSSAIYETKPVACETGAGKFLNAVVEFEYIGDPRVFFAHLLRSEKAWVAKQNNPQTVCERFNANRLNGEDH